ncbi:MAG: SDR family oxidoreductase [Rhodococcus sp. (in: high G+C Gram-positive bacteria)]|uniref:SDR family oxidoreductase n=1 Tax=Rhodococcus sp. TaxID=1831 RepID=UPI003BB10A3B
MLGRHPIFELRDSVVAITGGARGIGKATAAQFRDAGARVVIGDLDADLAGETARELGGGVVATGVNVADPESFRQFIEFAESTLGPVDVLVNNAGIMPLADLIDESDSVTQRIVDVNLHGVITGTKLVTPGMIERRRGHIINVASAVGRIAVAGAATYSASKYAVIGFSEAMRSELAPAGVHVSCILPTVVNTELAVGIGTVHGSKPVSAEDVATTILKVSAAPKLETWVPARAQALYKVASLLPRGFEDWLSDKMGASNVLSKPDAEARAAYDRRTQGDISAAR